MFSERPLDGELSTVRETHASGAVVLNAETDFETLEPAVAEQLGLRADALSPLTYDPAWVPPDAPEVLSRLAADEFTVGAPGDGGVVWTRQTEPPFVLVKPRVAGSPEGFVDFLVAMALVEAGTELPEQFLGFFRAEYRELADATPLDPADTYQLANALYDAYVGLHTRETFVSWADDHPQLHEQFVDAGDRLRPRLADLSGEVARGETSFAAAAELACSAVRHATPDGPSVPAPFSALDTSAYRHHGPEYAVQWAEKTFEKL
ncbi:hypothetical protein [Halosegnis sp.]|uniref:DUF7089 family protein n=1 Tax=Halosegnis sp. TaxID=2864959 RepID=UPI0035D4BFB4